MAWHPAEADTSPFVSQCPEEIHDLANQRVFCIFALNCLEATYWVRVDYDIALYRTYVLIIVQCQGNGRCHSSKDRTVIWESFGQLAASPLIILDWWLMSECWCPLLLDLRSVSVDIIIWSLGIAILNEFGLSLFTCDHAFAHPFNEAVYLRIVSMCSRRKAWCLQGADHFYVNLCNGHDFYLETNRLYRWSGHSSIPFGLGRYRSRVGSNSCSAWCAGLSVQARVFR